MATTQRQYPGTPVNGTSSRAASISAATTGVKLTYTTPVGRQAIVRMASIFPTAGAATIQFRASLNGNIGHFGSGVGAQVFAGGLALDGGDTCSLEVTVLDAAGVFDGIISVEEYLAQ